MKLLLAWAFAAGLIIAPLALTNAPPHVAVAYTNQPPAWNLDLPPSGKTNPPALLSSQPETLEAASRAAFADGVRFGILALTRNQDVHDLRVLQQIAWQLREQALRGTNQL